MSSDDDSPGKFYNELYVVDSDDEAKDSDDEAKDSDDEAKDLLGDSMIVVDDDEDAGQYEMEPGPSGYTRKEVEDISDEDHCRTPSPLAYSPLSSPEHGRRSPSLSRSRSPLNRKPDSIPQSLSETVIIGFFDENGVPLEGGMDEDPQEYSAPTAHSLFVPVPAVARSPSVRRERTRMGGRAGRPPRNDRPPPPITRDRTKWKVGMPLQEVFKTDEEVPPEILALAQRKTESQSTRSTRQR